MKNNKKRSFSIIVSVLLLVLACAIVFSACKKETVTPTPDPDTTQNDPDTNTDNETNDPDGGSETETPVLNVSFDESATYQLDSFDNALDVKIISNGTGRAVNFTVKSAEITADGKFIQATVTAEGLEKTILLPYASETLAIREELIPLYNLLTKEGDQSFALTLSGQVVANSESEAESFVFKVIVNQYEDDLAFALTDANAENEKAFVIFQDGVFNIFGQTLSVEELEELLEYLAPFMGESDFEDYDPEESEPEDDAFEFEEESQPEKESIDNFFVALSAALDTCDAYEKTSSLIPLPSMLQSMFPMSFLSVKNGVYTINVKLDKLPDLINFFSGNKTDNKDSDFDLTEIINRLEELFGDEVKDVDLIVSLALKESGVSFTLQLKDDRTGGNVSATVELDISEETFELPEEFYSLPELPELPELSTLWELLELSELPELFELPSLTEVMKDIEIVIPIQLPQNEFEAELKAIIRLSNFAADAECKDYVTATMTINGQEDALRFVLNDGYVYLDITGLFAMLTGNPAFSDFGTFYQAFEIDGEPASVFDILSSLIFNTDQQDDAVDDENGSLDDPDDETPAWDEPTAGECVGVGYSVAQDLVFQVNTIDEQALRDLLTITLSFEGSEEDLVVTDYQIEGFDPMTPCSGEIVILIPEYDIEINISIVIYLEAELYDIQADAMSIPVGTTVAEAIGSYVWVEAIMRDTTDEDIQWSVYPNDFSIQSIDFMPVEETTAFSQTGNHILVIGYSDKQTIYVVTVYDPENLQLVDVECEALVYLEKNATEEELREQLYVVAVYDDGSREPIEDYEIEGFDPEKESIVTVTWGDYTLKATVSIWDYNDDGPDYGNGNAVGFSLEDLLQSLRLDAFMEDGEFDFSKLAALYEENKELIDSIVSIDENGTLIIAINTPDDQDLLAVLNLFAGIPSEDGLQDIDENSLAAQLNNPIFAAMFEKMIGVNFEDFLADLYLTASASLEDGFTGKIELADYDGLQYFTIAVKINLVDASVPFELTEEEIEKAQDFSILSSVMLGIF